MKWEVGMRNAEVGPGFALRATPRQACGSWNAEEGILSSLNIKKSQAKRHPSFVIIHLKIVISDHSMMLNSIGASKVGLTATGPMI